MKVLLLEDNPADVRLIREALAEAGEEFDIEFEGRLSQALARLDVAPVDVIVVDLSLPDSHGLDTVRRVRDHARGSPIVVLSGLSDEDLAVRAVKEGAQDYLVKGDVSGGTLARALRHARERLVILTRLERANETLLDLSLTDDLTGLYNRRGFKALAEQQLKAAARAGSSARLLLVDVDDLKHINDAFGHEEGDRALVDTARILERTFRDADIKARLGGDEFAVLIADESEIPESFVLRRLCHHVEERNHRNGPSVLSLSVGIARRQPKAGTSIDELMASADRAMYREKRAKKIRR